ncbi:MAG: tetratricopeptide repeat protein [Candidatus Desantisbacteria bacterium]
MLLMDKERIKNEEGFHKDIFKKLELSFEKMEGMIGDRKWIDEDIKEQKEKNDAVKHIDSQREKIHFLHQGISDIALKTPWLLLFKYFIRKRLEHPWSTLHRSEGYIVFSHWVENTPENPINAFSQVVAEMNSAFRQKGIIKSKEYIIKGRGNGYYDLILKKEQYACDITEADSCLKEAEMLIQGKNMSKAKEVVLKAIDLDPDSPDAWKLLGDIYEGLGEVDKAKEPYRLCLAQLNREMEKYEEVRRFAINLSSDRLKLGERELEKFLQELKDILIPLLESQIKMLKDKLNNCAKKLGIKIIPVKASPVGLRIQQIRQERDKDKIHRLFDELIADNTSFFPELIRKYAEDLEVLLEAKGTHDPLTHAGIEIMGYIFEIILELRETELKGTDETLKRYFDKKIFSYVRKDQRTSQKDQKVLKQAQNAYQQLKKELGREPTEEEVWTRANS